MEGWELLNDLRRSFYCNRKVNYSQELKELVSLGSKSDDAEFIKSVLLLREDIQGSCTKLKLLWLTSRVGSGFYPPLDVDQAGPLPWNGPYALETNVSELRSKYPSRSPLSPEEGSDLRQCRDIDNCSFVASLIGMKVQNVSRPKIKLLSKGIYAVNLHFNGATERVVNVDASRIPTDKHSNQLSIHSGDLNDKIVELALLQITAGSYDTKGSNCAIDTFRLTGFLPEVMAARHCDVKRLIKYFESGLCIVAIGTGSDALKLVDPLIEDHDYAVVAVDRDKETVMIQDPLEPKTQIEIDQDKLENSCEQVYLNWCHLKLFYHKTRLHFFYKAENCNRFNSITDKPMFVLKNRSNTLQPVRLLLETGLRDEPCSENRIAYLKEVPADILAGSLEEPAGACNIGLQLVKLDLKPGQCVRLFCHSSHSESFTAHMVHNSELASFNRETGVMNFNCVTFDAPKGDLLTSCNYFKNPTIRVKVASPLGQEVPVHMQLLSDSPEDMINAQIYHAYDHTLMRPIKPQADFEQQKYDLGHVQLITNTPYKVVCSSYSESRSNKFKLIVKTALRDRLEYKVRQVYLEYGGLPHHLKKQFEWPKNSNRVKIRLTSKSNNLCFIRIVPLVQTPSVSIRCNVFDEESHRQIHRMELYDRPNRGGLVIDQLSIDDCETFVLLIEKDEALLPGEAMATVHVELLIGSQTKVSFTN